MSAKILSYIHYNKYKIWKYMPVAFGAGAATIFLGTIIPYTFGTKKFMDVMAYYENGEPKPIPEDFNAILQKVLYRVHLKTYEEARIKFFTAFGMEPTHFGSCTFRMKTAIGFPSTFYHSHRDQLDVNQLRWNNKLLDIESEDGQNLINSLILSPKAKAFVMAREIQYTNSVFGVITDAFEKSIMFFSAYFSGNLIGSTFQLKQRVKAGTRGCIYATIGAAWFFIYFFLNDAHQYSRHQSADKDAASLGKVYAEGGVEYYTKTLQRNKALRNLIGEAGKTLFSEQGNQLETLRLSHPMITTRLKTVESELKKFDSEKDVAFDYALVKDFNEKFCDPELPFRY